MILVLSPVLAPAFTSGGTSQSIAGILGRVGDHEFRVITTAVGVDGQATSQVPHDRWEDFRGTLTWYCSSGRLSPRLLVRFLREFSPDVVYLNSFFDPWFGLVPLLVMNRLSARKGRFARR